MSSEFATSIVTLRSRPWRDFLVAASILLLVLNPISTYGQNASQSAQSQGLTNDEILALVRSGVSQEQLIALIQATPSSFDLSAIRQLRAAGVPKPVLDAMYTATYNLAPSQTPAPTPTPGTPSPTVRQPAGYSASPSAEADSQGNSGTQTPSPDDQTRLDQARHAQIPQDHFRVLRDQPPGCPNARRQRERCIDLDVDSPGNFRLCRSANYCFAVHGANPLYDWSLNGTVSEPTGNPFDLISDAIKTLSSLGGGTTKGAAPPSAERTRCPDLTQATQAATVLSNALSALMPGKDSNGHYPYVSNSATQNAWMGVTDAFNAFEQAVSDLVQQLGPIETPSDCPTVTQAESIILDDFPKLRGQYLQLQARLKSPDVRYWEGAVGGYDTVDITATPSYSTTPLTPVKFHMDPCFPILSSSAGFLLTWLQARSYTSATAPNPSDPTTTQNVLNVDYGKGVRPALLVLLTGNIPGLNSHNFGLGLSAGPVFDISNGKADTSHFGFFGGPSVRVTPWIYLTPGVHVGEFADFPQGFTHSGQVIPANTGTPTPQKRYTARLAFSITFKLKDLGASTTADQSKSSAATKPSSAQ